MWSISKFLEFIFWFKSLFYLFISFWIWKKRERVARKNNGGERNLLARQVMETKMDDLSVKGFQSTKRVQWW